MSFSAWWEDKSILEKIVNVCEESLRIEAQYEATVYVRTVMKSGFYGLLLEVSGEFRFDVRAIRALRNLVSEKIHEQLGVELAPKRIIVVFHESSKRISQNPSDSLAEEMNRCRGLRRAVANHKELATMESANVGAYASRHDLSASTRQA